MVWDSCLQFLLSDGVPRFLVGVVRLYLIEVSVGKECICFFVGFDSRMIGFRSVG